MSVFTRDGGAYLDHSLVPSVVRRWNLAMYFRIAIITVLVYDAIITMDREARYFWKIPRNTVNFVYFSNRYVGVFNAAFQLYYGTFNPRLVTCKAADWALNITSWATVILLDYILMIRVLALYSQDRTLSFILKILLAMEAGLRLGLIMYLARLNHFVIVELATDAAVCGPDAIGPLKWIMVDWIIPMVYGTILMILAVCKAAEYWRVSAGFKGFTLVKVLLRDQVLYFTLAISCSVLNIIANKLNFSSVFLADIFGCLANPAWLSLLGSRVLFNLKEAGERGQNEGTSYSMPSGTVSDIGFADPGSNQRESWTEGVESANDGAAEA